MKYSTMYSCAGFAWDECTSYIKKLGIDRKLGIWLAMPWHTLLPHFLHSQTFTLSLARSASQYCKYHRENLVCVLFVAPSSSVTGIAKFGVSVTGIANFGVACGRNLRI